MASSGKVFRFDVSRSYLIAYYGFFHRVIIFRKTSLDFVMLQWLYKKLLIYQGLSGDKKAYIYITNRVLEKTL